MLLAERRAVPVAGKRSIGEGAGCTRLMHDDSAHFGSSKKAPTY
jgi:hypothetical protein